MSSGRIPRTTFFPANPCRAGRADRTEASTRSRCLPKPANQLPSACSRVASTMFMAGDPMNPATKMFRGWSYRVWGGSTCWSMPFFITATRSPMVMASIWSWVT